jgi:hypothetical protein
MVFLSSPHRETHRVFIKNKNRPKPGFGFFADWEKKLRRNSFVTLFCCAFELQSLRNSRKRDKTNRNPGELTSIFVVFFGKRRGERKKRKRKYRKKEVERREVFGEIHKAHRFKGGYQLNTYGSALIRRSRMHRHEP